MRGRARRLERGGNDRTDLGRVPGTRVRRRASIIDGRDQTQVDEIKEGRDAHLTAATARRAVRLEARHLFSLATKTGAVLALAPTTRRAPPLLTFGLAAGRCATEAARFTSRERARSVFPGGVSPEARAGRLFPPRRWVRGFDSAVGSLEARRGIGVSREMRKVRLKGGLVAC